MITNRVDGLDAARASMMLFGVFLHILIFSTSLIDAKSVVEEQAILGVYFTGHTFRLPAFFVLAGFFAGLLIAKRGPSGYLRNRGRRLGLVLLTIAPFMVLITMVVSGEIEYVQSFSILVDKGFLHLWFVYYLLIFSVLTYLLSFVRIPEWLSGVQAHAGAWITNPKVLWVAPLVLTAAPLFLDNSASTRTSTSLIPDLALFGFYGLFFFVGTLLFRAGQSALDALARRAIVLTVVGLVAAQLAFGWGTTVIVGPPKQFLSIVATFYLSLGVIGLFVRFGKKAGPVWGYLTRTSYWVYLVHPPFAYAFLQFLGNLALAPFATISIAFVASVALSLASFELLVRRTPLARLV